MKKIFIVLLLLVSYSFAQPEFHPNRDAIQSGKFYNAEVHYFPSDSGLNIFYIYKISYSQLFFEKNSDHFNAGINVNIEILDSSGAVVERKFDSREVSLKDFELTNSEEHFVNGLLNFNLNKGKYSIIAVISDLISKRSRTLPPKELVFTQSDIILNPIVINPNKILCSGQEFQSIEINSMVIPFNQPLNSVLIPVTSDNIKKLKYSIFLGDSSVIKDQETDKYVYLNKSISICENTAGLTKQKDQDSIKYFIINNFTSHLTEGPIKFEVTAFDGSNSFNQKFDMDVVWIHKPRSLLEPEEAIKFLEIIEPKEKISQLLGYKDLRKALFSYWKEKDPTPETNYNELMNEFYSRIDYCEMSFKPINGNSGSKTDRGKIYIKFGKPDTIERDSNIEDKVVETWFYKNLKRSFIFIDYEGTGKFRLVSEQ